MGQGRGIVVKASRRISSRNLWTSVEPIAAQQGSDVAKHRSMKTSTSFSIISQLRIAFGQLVNQNRWII